MLKKIYLEITNICNLSCSFCHKTKREKKLMGEEEFERLTDKLKGKADFLYFHLMGEPLFHPLLPLFLKRARDKGFLPIITTNGTLIKEKGDAILENLPYKISISLHAPDANTAFSDESYLDSCIDFAKKASGRGCYIALRLWNLGTDADNSNIINKLRECFPMEWKKIRDTSFRIADNLFLEFGKHFEWPDMSAKAEDEDADVFCYALRDQIGVLCDGSVVPCCLDADGVLTLGNLFEQELDEIMHSKKAEGIYNGFTKRRAYEEFCRKCGYARRFSK